MVLGSNLKPMAPSTACAMLLLSLGIFAYQRWPSKALARGSAHFAALGVALMGLLVLAQWLGGCESPIEGWLTNTTDRVGHVPVGRMSPLTATAFLLAALAFVLELPPLGRRWWYRQLASMLSLAVASIGLVVVLSYAAGMPLLYDTHTVPMAALTALSLAAIALGLLATAGADTFPLSLFQIGPKVVSGSPQGWVVGGPLLTFLLLSVGIGTVGYVYFRYQVTTSRQAAENELSAITDLKVRQILKWRQERLGDGREIMRVAHSCQEIEEFFADPAHREARSELLEWLEAIREHNEGLRVVLLDRQMKVRLALPEHQTFFGPIAEAFALQALRSNDVAMSDLHPSRFTGEIHLDLAIPVNLRRAPSGSGDSKADVATSPPLSVIVIEVDPEKYLYPEVKNWPTPSPTGETLLVRREGDEVVFLNELRHRKGAELSLRLPIDDQELPAAQAVLGHEGVVEGLDYRGELVLAVTRSIPGTPWSIVAKVDQSEIYVPMRRQALTTGALVLVFVVAAALGVGLMGRGHDARWLRSRLAMEREHRLILDSADEGIVGQDAQGRCVFVNPAACRMLGYEPEELIGTPSHAMWHRDKADGTPSPSQECPICAVLDARELCRCNQEVFWRKDGTSLPVEYATTPSLEKDRSVALVVIFRDITERKRGEAALRQSEERHRVLFESSRDAIMTLAPPSWKFTSGNPATVEMFGTKDEAQFTSLGPWELSPDMQPDGRPSADKAREMIETATREGSHFFEWTHRRLGGEDFPATVLLTRMELNRKTFLQATVRDITVQKRVEDELRFAISALESANIALEEFNSMAQSATRAKSEFLANMSHEIRTPMTAILGYANFLASEEGIERAPPHRREAITTIKRNGEYLLGLINSILDLSKVESGKLEIQRVRCSPFALLEEVVSLMRVRAAEKSLPLEAEAVGLLPETVLTDPLRLRQILVNLVGNAVKFTNQGEVRVAARLVCDGGPQGLQFDVTDTGIGISEEQMAKLFQPFSQVDGSASRKFSGTGLGLAISKRLVEALGGAIGVRSAPGKGSTFSVTIDPGPLEGIPLVQQTEATVGSASPAAAPAASGATELHARVLLAEDGPDNQRLISFLLNRAGADVTAVENGQLAVEAALAQSEAGRPFDVILMDMQMPVMDGYTATQQLREQGYTGPIVALTAHAMVEDRQKCLDAGCDDYLSKPIQRGMLLEAVAGYAEKTAQSALRESES
jgi:PAS domain S-box-containing protein